jgi:hypothetical protein
VGDTVDLIPTISLLSQYSLCNDCCSLDSSSHSCTVIVLARVLIYMGQVYAQTGDMVTYQAVEDYDGYYLLVPSEPETEERVQNYLENAMLIPTSAVTLDGRDCDKIGVPYYAFAHQSDMCSKSVGDCLYFQLDDYHDGGEHFISAYGMWECYATPPPTKCT